MKSKKFRALAAILLSVIMLSTSLTAAFAAAPQSTNATSPWHNFPEQKRYSYQEGYTYAIQEVLYYCGDEYQKYVTSIDGKFGPRTETAVEMFQINMKLSEQNGIVNAETWDALFSCLHVVGGGGPVVTRSITTEFYYVSTHVGVNMFSCVISAGRYTKWQVNIAPYAATPNWKNVNY